MCSWLGVVVGWPPGCRCWGTRAALWPVLVRGSGRALPALAGGRGFGSAVFGPVAAAGAGWWGFFTGLVGRRWGGLAEFAGVHPAREGDAQPFAGPFGEGFHEMPGSAGLVAPVWSSLVVTCWKLWCPVAAA